MTTMQDRSREHVMPRGLRLAAFSDGYLVESRRYRTVLLSGFKVREYRLLTRRGRLAFCGHLWPTKEAARAAAWRFADHQEARQRQ